ncbi:MAG TPA: transglycosylase SLT domain-containing protein [Ktedonobacteraceae bacterium]|nr:transglycosylase SLT domain-containing protein [Ktedonobacteraceae bacterium]
MSQFHSIRSYQHNTDDMTGERYPESTRITPPTALMPNDTFAEQYPLITTEQLAAISQQKRVAQTDQLKPLPQPFQDASTAQSLLTALEATITPAGRQPTVIPGAKKRARTGRKSASQGRHLHPHLRSGIVIVAVGVVLLISLLSLTPLGKGQSLFRSFSSMADWVKAQQQDWAMASQNGTTTQAVNAPVLPPMNLPKSMYVAIARQDAINVGINPDYFVRQINQESGFNPNAVSPAGAVGIAQFLPSTAAGLGIDPYDPIQALKGAAQYMATYAKQYGGDYAKALAAYNAGSGTVANAVRLGGANWMNYLPLETRNYIRIIMGI